MASKGSKTKFKAKVSKKNKLKTSKKKITDNTTKEKKKMNTKLLMVITFFTGVLLIISSYAWLSASLNVRVEFFDLVVSTDNGLFISLDGIEFSDSIEISRETLIGDLEERYPNHTNQWASNGLWPVSSNGIKTPNDSKFEVYVGEVSRRIRRLNNRRFLNTRIIEENEPSEFNAYIAFDLFLKNVSGSPKSDNLFIDKGTAIDFEDTNSEEIVEAMTGVMNSMRFGFVKMGSVSSKEDINTIQNINCNNNCQMHIYEPNSLSHSSVSANAIKEEFGVILEDGKYSPTYAVIAEGEMLDHVNGQEGTGVPLDTEHFALQNTLTDIEDPIYQIPNGITKLRAYVWLEGQDMDSLEVKSKGAGVYIAINFVKDLAGYE